MSGDQLGVQQQQRQEHRNITCGFLANNKAASKSQRVKDLRGKKMTSLGVYLYGGVMEIRPDMNLLLVGVLRIYH